MGDNRVRITGARGKASTNTYKVSATYADGYKTEAILGIFGPEASKKAQLCGEIILQRVADAGFNLERAQIECLGAGSVVGGVAGTVSASAQECVLRVAAQIQILYGLRGERRLPEFEAPWLCGYAGSRPVRIGNAAVEQLQIDVYGEVADVMYQAHRAGLLPDTEEWALTKAVVEAVEQRWSEIDHGLWEVRGDVPALRALEGARVGRARPRDLRRRELRPGRPGGPLARAARAHPRARCAATATNRSARRSRSRTARKRSTRRRC